MPAWHYRPAKDIHLSGHDRLISPLRESGPASNALRFITWHITAAYLRIAHRLTVLGARNLPRQLPFVMIANHCSHLDAIVLACTISPGLRASLLPIAAGERFFRSSTRAAASALLLNALPLWRSRTGHTALANLRKRLVEEPCAYIIFPEGTRSRSGAIAPFKHGVGMLLAGSPVPVVPCHLTGTHAALPPGTCLPRLRRLTVRIGPQRCYAALEQTREAWRAIGDDLFTAIRDLANTPARINQRGP